MGITENLGNYFQRKQIGQSSSFPIRKGGYGKPLTLSGFCNKQKTFKLKKGYNRRKKRKYRRRY